MPCARIQWPSAPGGGNNLALSPLQLHTARVAPACPARKHAPPRRPRALYARRSLRLVPAEKRALRGPRQALPRLLRRPRDDARGARESCGIRKRYGTPLTVIAAVTGVRGPRAGVRVPERVLRDQRAARGRPPWPDNGVRSGRRYAGVVGSEANDGATAGGGDSQGWQGARGRAALPRHVRRGGRPGRRAGDGPAGTGHRPNHRCLSPTRQAQDAHGHVRRAHVLHRSARRRFRCVDFFFWLCWGLRGWRTHFGREQTQRLPSRHPSRSSRRSSRSCSNHRKCGLRMRAAARSAWPSRWCSNQHRVLPLKTEWCVARSRISAART